MSNVQWVAAGSETNPCCCATCHDLVGDTLQIVVSGLTALGCVNIGEFASQYSEFIGNPNGAFNATWNGTAWTVTLTTWLREDYFSDPACGGIPDAEGTFNYVLSITCAGDNQFTISGTPSDVGTGTFDEAIAIDAETLFSAYVVTILSP